MRIRHYMRTCAAAALSLLAWGPALAQEGLMMYVPSLGSTGLSVLRTNADGTLAPVTTIGAGSATAFAAVRGDQAVAYVTKNSTDEVIVIDTRTNAVVQTVAGFNGPRGITVSPDGTRVYVANNVNGGTVTAFSADPLTGQLTPLTNITPTTPLPRSLVFNGDGSRLYVLNQGNAGNGSIDIIDTATNTVIGNAATGGQLTALAINPAGTRLYATTTSNTVFVVDTATATVVASPTTGNLPLGVAVSRDGLFFYVTNANSFTVHQFDATTNSLINTAPSGLNPGWLALSPGGQHAYIPLGGTDDRVAVFSITPLTGALVNTASFTATMNDPSQVGMCRNGNGMLGPGATFVANTAAALNCAQPGVAFNGGTLRVNDAGLTFAHALQLGAGGATLHTNGNATSFTGVIAGVGALTKAGAGTLTLTGASTYLGATSVNAGTLVVSGSITSAVTVASGATLAGTGTVGATTVNGLGGLAPGPTSGILTTGNLAMTALASVEIQINGPTPGAQHDQVNVVGTVALGGAQLNAIVGFAPTVGQVFTIINNDGADAVSGTFAGLPEGSSFFYGATLLLISYAGGDGNDVTLTVASLPGAPVIGTATPGNGMATIAFSPPASNGGTPITGYTLTCTPGSIIATGAVSPIVMNGLANGTTYACSVTATNAVGTGPASATVSVMPFLAGTTTYSGPSATGTGTISASFTGGGGGTCGFTTPQFIGAPPGAAPIPPTAPGSTTFPHGLFDFRTTACTPGATLSFTITYPAALPAGTSYWKYGPTASNAAPHWYVLPATIVGNTATFTIVDGGLGDDDLAANGTIVDQGGPGVPGSPGTATAVPTLSEWMLMLLALLMLGVGMRSSRRLPTAT